MGVLLIVNVNVNRGSLKVTRKNEGVLPPQSVPVCGVVEAYNKRSLSIVAKGYRLRFKKSTPSALDPLGNFIPQRVTEDSGNASANYT